MHNCLAGISRVCLQLFDQAQVANSQKRDPLKPSSAKLQGSLQEAGCIESNMVQVELSSGSAVHVSCLLAWDERCWGRTVRIKAYFRPKPRHRHLFKILGFSRACVDVGSLAQEDWLTACNNALERAIWLAALASGISCGLPSIQMLHSRVLSATHSRRGWVALPSTDLEEVIL